MSEPQKKVILRKRREGSYLFQQLPYFKKQRPPAKGEKFTDPLFPPTANSLMGLNEDNQPYDLKAYTDNKDDIKMEEITFMRASEIFKDQKYLLFQDKIEMADIKQGGLGDCYFLASIANLANYPSLIFRMFKTKEINDEGYFEIIFHIDDTEQIVIVDDYLPVNIKTKQPCFAQPNGNEIWVMILEKAWAKINGGYLNITGGLPHEALECLTGFGSETFNTEKADVKDLESFYEEIALRIKVADKHDAFISCGTSSTDKNYKNFGLVEGHAYTLIDVFEITSKGKKIDLFKIRNPWSKGEWTGDWSDKSDLWGEEEKKQVNFDEKDDGIFFMCYKDFFKYFVTIEICGLLYGGMTYVFEVDGEENIKDGNVYNVELKKEGILSVTLLRKNWRIHRELRGKIIPSHVSIVKYDSKEKNRNKIFSEYSGGYDNLFNCTVTKKCDPGNYLIYVYQDHDYLDFEYEKKYSVKISSSLEDFNCVQMQNDEREKGFPLLQNLILQAEFVDDNFDPDSGDDFNVSDNQFHNNGIGYAIFYFGTPGVYLDYSGDPKKLTNFIMLSPYTNNEFHRFVPAGKFLVLLGIIKGLPGTYCFNCYKNAYTTNYSAKLEFEDNEIDFDDYIIYERRLKHKDSKSKKRTMSTEMAKNEFYFESGEGQTVEVTKEYLEQNCPTEMKLILELPETENNSVLKWGVNKGQYVTYMGQVNDKLEKEGRGMILNPKNVFIGQFSANKPNGIGILCDLKGNKLFAAMFESGMRLNKLDLKEVENLCKKGDKKNVEMEDVKRITVSDRKQTSGKKGTKNKKKNIEIPHEIGKSNVSNGPSCGCLIM